MNVQVNTVKHNMFPRHPINATCKHNVKRKRDPTMNVKIFIMNWSRPILPVTFHWHFSSQTDNNYLITHIASISVLADKES